ncbi:hypothetical protein ACFO3I_02725 [Rheinheimera marina]|uniref:Uncharacterized protein n=1 Tax=Rheinheimera marina TaxID=1774958 RepID=A0ABV9JIL8_9GAMM
MLTYTAIPAQEQKGGHGLVLIDPGRLAMVYEWPANRLLHVTKTAIYGDLAQGWSFCIEEFGVRTVLLYSNRNGGDVDAGLRIDLIEHLGHGLIIMPSQKLIFKCSGFFCNGVTYIE